MSSSSRMQKKRGRRWAFMNLHGSACRLPSSRFVFLPAGWQWWG